MLSDQTIRLKAQECPLVWRRLAYRDGATGRRYVFLTNHFKLAAKTIADIYKERGQIEIFFRVIKQNLRIKAFIGNDENAVLTQIYAALFVYLLLCYLKFVCNLMLLCKTASGYYNSIYSEPAPCGNCLNYRSL